MWKKFLDCLNKLYEAFFTRFGVNRVYPGRTCGPFQISQDGMYQVDVFKGGIKRKPVRCRVYQLQIDPREAMPEGHWVMVLQMGNDYYMQTPVWADNLKMPRPEDWAK